jgi:hypothetical protein
MSAAASRNELAENAPYNTPEYAALVRGVDEETAGHHQLSYVPFSTGQQIDGIQHFSYESTGELQETLARTDAIICISRDEDLSATYTDQYPDRNISLTPSGEANVAKSVQLYHAAREQGNDHVQFIATGRMHNRAIGMMLSLPIVAEFAGINAEDAYHIPEKQFEILLDKAFTTGNIHKLPLDTEGETAANTKALVKIFTASEHKATIPTTASSQEELNEAKQAFLAEYKKYPRMSTSRLMVERAHKLGVPLEDIHEEDGAVDTISSLVFTQKILESIAEQHGKPLEELVIVAGSDHLPRTAWIADHILQPDATKLTFVESEARLSPEAYTTSCIRELGSFIKGSAWIGGTRDPAEIEDIVEKGYFGKERQDASELAAAIGASTLTDTVTR